MTQKKQITRTNLVLTSLVTLFLGFAIGMFFPILNEDYDIKQQFYEKCSDMDLMTRYPDPKQLKQSLEDGTEQCTPSEQMQTLMDHITTKSIEDFNSGIITIQP